MKGGETAIKIILIGDSGVGKTSIVRRYINGEFDENEITVGLDFFSKEVELASEKINVHFWDTAGQEKYGSLVANIFTGANGIIIVFDLSSVESFNNVQKWMDMIVNKSRSILSMILVGNKLDLDRQVSFEQANNYAKELNIPYIETSAVDGRNIDDAFFQIISLSYDDMKKDTEENVLIEKECNAKNPCTC